MAITRCQQSTRTNIQQQLLMPVAPISPEFLKISNNFRLESSLGSLNLYKIRYRGRRYTVQRSQGATSSNLKRSTRLIHGRGRIEYLVFQSLTLISTFCVTFSSLEGSSIVAVAGRCPKLFLSYLSDGLLR